MVFNYQFGGVEISSDIPLIGLRRPREISEEAPKLRVLVGEGASPTEETLHFAWNGRFQMRLGETGGQWLTGSPWGSFLFDREASTLRIFGADGAQRTILLDMLLRRLLPRLVKLKGAATYHAASLAQDDSAVLIMGPSGAGKSTMSVGLAATGDWDILGDDMALLWHDAGDLVAPAAADVTIWPQSCAGLNLAAEDCEPLLGYGGKNVYRPRRAVRLEPVPLKGIFLIHRTECEAPSVRRLTRAEAFGEALRQVVFFNPSGDARHERVQSVTRLNDMLRRIPAWTLTYPPSYDAMGAVSDALSAALRDG